MGPLTVELRAPSPPTLAEHAGIPIAFEVREIVDITTTAGTLLASPVETPYVKDYDALAGENPRQWPDRFDMAHWQLFGALRGGRLVGGAAAVAGSPDIEMCEGSSDLAVIWDIRVSPGERRRGIGSALFRAIEAWATAIGCRRLKVETQDTNVAACRFYARQGCALRAVHRFAYPELPHEVQMLWYKDLPAGASGELP